MRYQRAVRAGRHGLPILILLLAFALRLYRLDYYDISGDEAWSITVAGWPLSEIVASNAETNPPLYHIFLHLMMRFGGDSALVIRYGSILFGLLAISFIGRLGAAVGGRRLGWMAMFVAATSPFLIYYAQDARMYGPALMGSAGSLATFATLLNVQWRKQRAPFPIWILYVAISLVAVYSHYYAFAILLSQALYLALSGRGRWQMWRSWLIAWLTMAILFVPWLFRHSQYLDSKASGRFEEWTLTKLLEIGRRTYLAYGAGVTLPASDAWHGWAICALALIGLGACLYQSRQRHFGLLSAVVMLVSVLFAWGVNPIMPFFYERYLLVGMPIFLVLVAAGILALFRNWKPAALVGMSLVVFVSASSLRNQFYDPFYNKGGYGRLMAEIESQAHPGDLMLLNNPLQSSLFDYYQVESIPFAKIDRGKILAEESTSELLTALTGNYQRVWLVETGDPASYDPRHRVQRWLGERGSRAFYQNYGNGNILQLFFLASASEQKHPLNAVINQQILLTGYAVSPAVSRGDTLLLTLYWEATAPIERGYTVFTHLLNAQGQLVAQTDGQPGGGAQPTDSWQLRETIEDKYALLLPEDLATGTYTLRVGMYLWPELSRLPVESAQADVIDDAIVLGSVEILSDSS